MNSKLNNLEEYLKEKILPDLEKSRGGFDKIHTLEVVGWLKQIISHNPELRLDETVLTIAAYAHDWGYSEIFKDGQIMDIEVIENAKKLHMKLGAEKIEKLLHSDIFSFLTKEQKARIVHLVAVHDKKFEIRAVDEIILMEADVLSGLDVNTEKPILDTTSNINFMDSMLNIRIPKFITEFSKHEAKRLIQAREDYFRQKEKVTQKYVDSDEYQNEIAQQYKKRVSTFTRQQVLEVLRVLKIPNLPNIDEVVEAGAGTVNATFLTKDFAIKLNQRKERPEYLANKIVSERLGLQAPVVEVIAYDYFNTTPFEILVMKRSSGSMLLDDILEMSEQDREIIFQQVLDVIEKLFSISFSNFGLVNLDGKESFATYSDFLVKEFDGYVAKIMAEKLCTPEDIKEIETYFKKHIHIFDNCEPVFVHTDTHMGNILHEGMRLTALIDFDSSLKAPKVRALNSLLGFIDNPQQFAEGTKDFPKFKGKNFYHLLPILKSKFPEIFSDPQLLRKLNLISIKEGIMWVSQNWSTDWNAEMINGMIENELPKDDLSQTYHGKILLNQKICLQKK